mmetsp:Transcript_42414/g.40660  ORF Transcript_42414/g.40660 Transcript_42414/m.40660 type:complete len:93 (+) Transcript_42414:501-779(+)|eukprot:CAMPEP_0170542754 /NCGR_PEP_ID=MMETSP0211-20121228/2086_1 /TAXON_ID=311385 /ORGANISM="Pseudokeronopsis sp., Strain OXSARD2" /LENGTH=92 /DNA_ID=CAMNT_0010845925 /DNA_START=437 /DNA_END=715 /DNA_ORIENTATION=-
MKYSEFLDKMTQNEYSTAMKEEGVIEDVLLEDIIQPAFIADVSRLESTQLIQGRLIMSEGHYDKKEQIMCAIDGFISVKMIPHIARQELYAG